MAILTRPALYACERSSGMVLIKDLLFSRIAFFISLVLSFRIGAALFGMSVWDGHLRGVFVLAFASSRELVFCFRFSL